MSSYLNELIEQGVDPASLVNDFAKYSRRQVITQFLARYELYKMIQNVQGNIVEGGVYAGQGLMTWAQLSAIFEPIGGTFREIIGFDTFDGFPEVSEKDQPPTTSGRKDIRKNKQGDFSKNSYDDLCKTINLFDMNRFLPQFDKVKLVRGDFLETANTFLNDNPHFLISLLYLDFDIYGPTKHALELFLPRMPKGSVLAFDEINHPDYPGETLALLESLDINKLEIKKFQYENVMSYIVL